MQQQINEHLTTSDIFTDYETDAAYFTGLFVQGTVEAFVTVVDYGDGKVGCSFSVPRLKVYVNRDPETFSLVAGVPSMVRFFITQQMSRL